MGHLRQRVVVNPSRKRELRRICAQELGHEPSSREWVRWRKAKRREIEAQLRSAVAERAAAQVVGLKG